LQELDLFSNPGSLPNSTIAARLSLPFFVKWSLSSNSSVESPSISGKCPASSAFLKNFLIVGSSISSNVASSSTTLSQV
jgi:hypothetical protein